MSFSYTHALNNFQPVMLRVLFHKSKEGKAPPFGSSLDPPMKGITYAHYTHVWTDQ